MQQIIRVQCTNSNAHISLSHNDIALCCQSRRLFTFYVQGFNFRYVRSTVPIYFWAHRIRTSIFTARRVCIARTMPWQDVCLSVLPSHAGIVSKRLHISSIFFSPSGSPTILVFPYHTGWQYFDEDLPNWGFECKGVWKKLRFSTNISLYLRNDTIGDRAFCFAGHRVWNSLSSSTQNAPSLPVFRRLLKYELFRRCHGSHLC